MAIQFTPLKPDERQRLAEALRKNATDGAALLTDLRTTAFIGTTEEIEEREAAQATINAIRSVPTHYGHRFDDGATIERLHDAMKPIFERAASRDELTPGQECFGAAIAVAFAHPECQSAADLLAWVHGQTPEGAFETARADSLEEWIAPEDMHFAEAVSHG